MTKRKEVMELMFWHSNKEWYYLDAESEFQIKEDAPERAKISFENWRKQWDEA